ncbi:MAG: LuxR C-terminal-related transcriptional regulator [Chloroflexota bacterium]|nr:LuxR C-terminal-related transcriptional regulator [Chloroflexota bacterium]
MPKLTTAQQHATNRLLDLGKRGLDPETLAGKIVDVVGNVVPNDGVHLWTVDPGTMLLNRLLTTSELNPENRRIWLRHHYLTELDEIVPYFSSRKMLFGNIRAAAILPEQGKSIGIPAGGLRQVSESEHRRWFHDSQSPAGGWGLIPLRADGQIMGLLMTLHRSSGGALTRSQVDFLKSVSGQIGQMLQAAIRREQALAAGNSGPDASGILVLGQGHGLRFATPAGETWTRLLLDAERDADAGLPTSIWAVVAALGREVATETGSVASLLAPTGAGVVRLEASRADDAGGVAIVISPHRQVEAPVVPETWPLTPAERRVAALVLNGATNGEISASLHISVPTVETHLAHIYDKLGIRNRTGLAALLFQSR